MTTDKKPSISKAVKTRTVASASRKPTSTPSTPVRIVSQTKADQAVNAQLGSNNSPQKSNNKKVLWIVSVIVALLIVILGYFLVRNFRTQRFIEKSWHQVVLGADKLSNEVTIDIRDDQIEESIMLANDLKLTIKDQSFASGNKTAIFNNSTELKRYQELLGQVDQYNNQIIENIEADSLDRNKLEALANAGENLKNYLDSKLSEFKFISEKISDDYYMVDQDLIDKLEQEEIEAGEQQASQEAEAQAEAQSQADQDQAQSNVLSFVEAMKNRNTSDTPAGMKYYMTNAYIQEFGQPEFDRITNPDDSYSVNDISSYRIVGTEALDNSAGYRVSVSVGYHVEYTDSDSVYDYTSTIVYRVIKSEYNNRWEVDGIIPGN
ncbi:hypothetical protein KA531_00355 [Candidatus Saccharibacteria bacterium]|nr:hypothetical protein [Candidatus Saccharibacteria bacterium]